MLNKTVWKRTWRCSLISMITMTIFWYVWYLIAGNVPEVKTVKMTDDWTFVLPFTVSRLWDIVFTGIWTAIIILIISNERCKKENLGFGLVVGLGFGLGFSLVFSLVFGLVFGLVVSLGFSLGFSLKFLIQNFIPGYRNIVKWLWPA